MEFTLPEINLLQIKQAQTDENAATFVLEPLSPGYGVTIGNSLRRVLLSSLAGAAISYIKIDGITHEFSTIPGVKEDVVDLILNLKGMRIKLHGDEPTTITLEATKSGEVKAKDFKPNPQVEIVDPNYHITTLDKNGKLYLEAYIEKGRGYLPTELKKDDKLPLGTIAIDSIFTPVKKVHYEVENTRVGRMTNFDKLTLDLTTDGTIKPIDALEQAAKILVEHFGIISELKTEKKEIEIVEEAPEVNNYEPEQEEMIEEEKPRKPRKAKEEKTAKKSSRKNREE
ncbi:MAG: DNA-directed RNA polymerase subunit alpha [bacterium]|nr:DNA-directed RNA polymerase subunit alpha [bacterium]